MNPDRQHSSAHAAFTVTKYSSRSLSLGIVLMALFAIDFPYQYGFRFLSLFESVTLAFLEALIFTIILWITTRLDLARVTL